MRGFGVTSVSFATETHLSRIALELDVDPYELRLKNANRIGDTSPNQIAYTDPSTVRRRRTFLYRAATMQSACRHSADASFGRCKCRITDPDACRER